MKQKIIIAGMVCFMLLTILSNGQAQDTNKKIRIGVYDNRAIAIAYFGSEYNPIINMRIEYNTAKYNNDSVKIREFEVIGPKFQRKIQFQGYCKVPVDDLLVYVSDKVDSVAKSANLDLIAGWSPDYKSKDVVLVDITDQLVALYNPSPDILEAVEDIKKVALTKIEDVKQVDYSKE